MNIKFVSYDGHYPNLCRGQLILNIDGKDIRFGCPYGKYDCIEGKDYDYDSFWGSGGYIDNDYYACSGDWIIYEEYLPDFLKDKAKEIEDLFNANVEKGCCGGCI